MSSSNEAVITNFVKEFEVAAPDPAKVGAYFTDDAVYHNIPMAPINLVAVRGLAVVHRLGALGTAWST
jgi:hypothetical protein